MITHFTSRKISEWSGDLSPVASPCYYTNERECAFDVVALIFKLRKVEGFLFFSEPHP